MNKDVEIVLSNIVEAYNLTENSIKLIIDSNYETPSSLNLIFQYLDDIEENVKVLKGLIK